MKRMIATLVLAGMAASVPAQRQAPMPDDAYGYQLRTSADPACAYQYLDLDGVGVVLDLVAAGSEPAVDDGGAELALVQPFEFYGRPAQSLVASSNGYLAPGADLAGEDGGYWRADCALPAIPDNALAHFGRIYALAGDLQQNVAGALHAQHFADCPRPSGAGGSEACTVLQWRNYSRLGEIESMDFQAVLYHGSWQIALQYRQLSANLTAPALAVGSQDPGAVSAVSAGCAADLPVLANSAICLFDPRFPPGAAPDDLIFADGFDSDG